MAAEMVDQVMESSIEELTKQRLLGPYGNIRSVGVDTRRMEADIRRRDRVINQMEEDFFPYIYKR